MATVLRPPLVFQAHKRPWAQSVDQPGRPITLNPVPRVRQLLDSAPQRRNNVHLDVFPNLLQTTLAPLPALSLPRQALRATDSAPQRKANSHQDVYPSIQLTLLSQADSTNVPLVQLYGSAPDRKPWIARDDYPNLLANTLKPAGVAFALPLAALRADWNAPEAKRTVQIDQPVTRPINLNPVPGIYGLTDSAPHRKYPVQIDITLNPVVLQPVPKVQSWDASAPPPSKPVQVDFYPNLSITTLLALVTVPDVTGETQAQATTDITNLGLTVTVQTEYSDTVATGNVTRQGPVGGTQVLPGSNVTIVISLGIAPKSTGAGRRTKRQLYIVQVDGNDFDFASLAEAVDFLNKAKSMAAQYAQSQVRVERKTQKVAPLKLPRISTSSPQLKQAVDETKLEIKAVYEQATRDIELKMWIKIAEDRDEDETFLLLM